MTSAWQSVLTSSSQPDLGAGAPGLHEDGIKRFGSGDTVLAPLTHVSVIRCAGEDAQSFLHNQLTTDINHLKVGSAQYSAWCTAKGRMLASFIVIRTADGFLMVTASDLVPMLVKRLRMFVLRSKVEVDALDDALLLAGMAGASAGRVLVQGALPAPTDPMTVAEFQGGWILRTHDDRYLIGLETQGAGEIWSRLSAMVTPVAGTVWRWLDIQSGLPWIRAATSEEFVPQMVGFDRLGGVSFHKGCYPGQEVVARTQYLGKVKRHLYRAQGTDSVAAGTPLFGEEDPGHPCGLVVDASTNVAGKMDVLAVIQESAVAGPVRIGSATGEQLAQLAAVDR